ncbi:MAG: alginate export family protein [Nitrospirae bacterium]|nr:alginate export family protein [Nitrospirota bacterium]
MKRKRLWLILLTIFVVAGLVSISYAEVKLGGELRVRGVMVDNSDTTTAGAKKDGGYFEQRTRLNADASVDENAKIVIQIQDSRKWGEKKATGDNTLVTGQDAEALDLAQGYVEIGKLFDQPLSVRLGRQAMAYGEHRLIGTLEWSNNARRFDALKFIYKHDVVDVDVWTAKVAESGEDWGNDDNLNGVYVTLKSIPKNAVDLYLLQKIAGATNLNFYTIGARVKGGVENVNVDYTAEVAVQTGDASTNVDKGASAYAIRAGYTVPNVKGLRAGVEYDAATGDKCVTFTGTTCTDSGTKNEAFDNLYPTNHYLYGFTDDVNWTNTNAWSLNVSLKPMDKVNLAVEYWNYKTDQENSAGKDDNGTEINGKLNYELSKNITCEAAYALRDAGDSAGPAKAYDSSTFGNIPADKSASFGYFLINVKFN